MPKKPLIPTYLENFRHYRNIPKADNYEGLGMRPISATNI